MLMCHDMIYLIYNCRHNIDLQLRIRIRKWVQPTVAKIFVCFDIWFIICFIYVWVIPVQIDLAVTLTILDFSTRSFRFFEKIFGINITKKNLKSWKWHCCMLSIWIKLWRYILSEKTNFLSHGRKWAWRLCGIYKKRKI